jgi:hypothetical protein
MRTDGSDGGAAARDDAGAKFQGLLARTFSSAYLNVTRSAWPPLSYQTSAVNGQNSPTRALMQRVR